MSAISVVSASHQENLSTTASYPHALGVMPALQSLTAPLMQGQLRHLRLWQDNGH